ncbi:MAG: TPM domain-containing protein [Lachnospiraceae bacterium]|nr:TPM domain-containing protein [Lachnospiraceae bacterium]
MEKYDVKVEERKKFLKSFLVWMILAGIALIAFLVVLVTRKPEEALEIPEVVRNNDIAPVERVYDYAEVLSDQEETDLRNLIADYEERSKCDLVLVTIDQAVGLSDEEWTNTMVNLADDFYDQKAFGYDQPHGDGALLMDNWYHAGQDDSQAGAWLSTSGKLEWAIGPREEQAVWDALDAGFEYSAYEAYARAIKKIAYYGEEDANGGVRQKGSAQLPWWLMLGAPIVIALIYAAVNMKQKAGAVTTTAMTYVSGGQPTENVRRDDFLRKSVSKVKIETSSSSRSGGGGSYGHHTSSGGFSHGGGGHRR